MLKRFAEWLLRVPPVEPGQGTTWHLSHRFPWAAWVLLLFAAGAAAFVILVYLRDAGHLARGKRLVLTALRLGVIGLALFLLSEAMLSIERTGLPYVLLLLDVSGSMGTVDQYSQTEMAQLAESYVKEAGLDQPSRLNLAKALLLRRDGRLLRDLAENHKLRIHLVADGESTLGGNYLAPDDIGRVLPLIRELRPQGGETRLGDALRSALNSLRGTPPSAVIVLSDGITTDGEKLSAAARYARQKSVPLHTVLLGSADPVVDAELHGVVVDDTAFVNDPVTFAYTLTSHGLSGKKARVVLRDASGADVLAEQSVALADDGKPQKLELSFTPAKVGEFELVLDVLPLPRETNLANNAEKRRITVRDEKIRVLLADYLPRWEFRFVKDLLEREKTIELKTVLIDSDSEYSLEDRSALPHFPVTRDELFRYDVAILGDLSPAHLSTSTLENLRDFVRDRGRGLLLIAGPYNNPGRFRGTALEPAFPVELDGVLVPPLDSPLSESFQLELTPEGRKGSALFRFGDSEGESHQVWQGLPGIFWHVTVAETKPGAIVYAVHPSRTTARGKLPIIVTQRYGDGKVLLHATDELWRWRFRTGNTYYGRYWVQVVRYLARSRLPGGDTVAELTADRKVYRMGAPVNLRLRFLDEKLAPAENDGVSVMVESSTGAQSTLRLSRVPEMGAVFEGQLAQAPEGKYHAWVTAPSFVQAPPACDFEVRLSEREMRVVRADAADMSLAASLTSGQSYLLTTAEDLARQIPPGLPVPLEPDVPISLWNHWLTLLMFAGALCAEWILRKRWRLV